MKMQWIYGGRRSEKWRRKLCGWLSKAGQCQPEVRTVLLALRLFFSCGQGLHGLNGWPIQSISQGMVDGVVRY